MDFFRPADVKNFYRHNIDSRKKLRIYGAPAAGLLKDKKAVLYVASGGVYEGAMAACDHLVPMLKTQLGFIGITDVVKIRAAGQGMRAGIASANLKAALEMAISVAGSI